MNTCFTSIPVLLGVNSVSGMYTHDGAQHAPGHITNGQGYGSPEARSILSPLSLLLRTACIEAEQAGPVCGRLHKCHYSFFLRLHLCLYIL